MVVSPHYEQVISPRRPTLKKEQAMDPLQRQTFQTMREIPVGEHLDLSETELDALPFGAIRLDAEGRVRSYNMAESELARRPKADVVGKLFFEEVAPCTNVHAFKGVLDALTQAGGGSEYLDFRFEFPWGSADVRIRIIVFDASERLILVTRIQS